MRIIRRSQIKERGRNFVSKTEKIKIKKKKKRIPLPLKPPKVEKNKKAYIRGKEKEKLRKEVSKEDK
jgi:hypothetical protein